MHWSCQQVVPLTIFDYFITIIIIIFLLCYLFEHYTSPLVGFIILFPLMRPRLYYFAYGSISYIPEQLFTSCVCRRGSILSWRGAQAFFICFSETTGEEWSWWTERPFDTLYRLADNGKTFRKRDRCNLPPFSFTGSSISAPPFNNVFLPFKAEKKIPPWTLSFLFKWINIHGGLCSWKIYSYIIALVSNEI